MNLLFTADRNYLPVLHICLRSILRFPCREGYRIYLMHSDLEPADLEELAALCGDGARLIPVPIDDSMLEGFPTTGRYPRQMYYRILAAQFLPRELDRVLYLDPDIIVINPLEELYRTDLQGSLLAACTHVKEFLSRLNRLRLGAGESCPYLNSGVLLMDLEALRREQSLEEVAAYVERYGSRLTLPDQDILSALYGERTLLLDTMRYNLSDRILGLYNMSHRPEERRLVDWVRANGVIIHYCGRNKPWKENYLGILDVFYREVAEA